MAEVMETSESRWFKIAVFIVSGFFVGISLANVIYFHRIRDATNTGTTTGFISSTGSTFTATPTGGCGITSGEALAMLWVNGIILVISLLIFIWSIYRLVAGREYRDRVRTYFREEGPGFIEAPPSGAPIPRLRSSRTVTTTTTATAAPARITPPATLPPPPATRAAVITPGATRVRQTTTTQR